MQIDKPIQYEMVSDAEAYVQAKLEGFPTECPQISSLALEIFSIEYARLQKAWSDSYGVLQRETAQAFELQIKRHEANRKARIQHIACSVVSGGITTALITSAWTTPVPLVASIFMTIGGAMSGVTGLSALCVVCEGDDSDEDEIESENITIEMGREKIIEYHGVLKFIGDIGEFCGKWSEFKKDPTEEQIPGLFKTSDKIKGFLKQGQMFDFLLVHHVCRLLDASQPMVKQWKALVEETSPMLTWAQNNIRFWTDLKRDCPSKRDYQAFYDAIDLSKDSELHEAVIIEARDYIQAI